MGTSSPYDGRRNLLFQGGLLLVRGKAIDGSDKASNARKLGRSKQESCCQ